MNVKNRNLQCLVDSGASTSIISDKLAHNLGLKIDHSISISFLVAATGQRLCNFGKVAINLYIKRLKVVYSFVVVKDLFLNFLIGADFLRQNSAVINYANNTVTFYEGLITVFSSVLIASKTVHVFIGRFVFQHSQRSLYQYVCQRFIAVQKHY